jgi:hypothetical protein
MYSEENIKNKIEDCINSLVKSTSILNSNNVKFHNETKLENFITEIKPFLKNIKNKSLIKKMSKAIYDYNIALYNYNKRNGTNYQGIGNSFRKAGIEGTENKFSVKSCFNY